MVLFAGRRASKRLRRNWCFYLITRTGHSSAGRRRHALRLSTGGYKKKTSGSAAPPLLLHPLIGRTTHLTPLFCPQIFITTRQLSSLDSLRFWRCRSKGRVRVVYARRHLPLTSSNISRRKWKLSSGACSLSTTVGGQVLPSRKWRAGLKASGLSANYSKHAAKERCCYLKSAQHWMTTARFSWLNQGMPFIKTCSNLSVNPNVSKVETSGSVKQR